MSIEITVYTKTPCPYCVRAKSLLNQKGLAFKEIHVDDDDFATREELFEKTGFKTFPQIFFGDHVVGGYAELKAIDESEGLKKFIETQLL
jgi:glutaredoxin 3